MLTIRTKIEGVGNKILKINELHVCRCKVSKPAKSFNDLIELVKQAEEVLIENGFTAMEDRISILRGIYYGTEWSLDFQVEGSEMRNTAFNIPYTGSSVIANAEKELKCCDQCKAQLFNSLIESYEVFDNKYKAIDFGHVIIGLDARRSWRSKNIHIPTQGGTGLEICTWVGDLGGGVGKLAYDRAKNSKKRAKTLFPVFGSSYGAMVNLEGDIAAYVVGSGLDDFEKIDDSTENFTTIHEALEDYFLSKWNNRAYYFLLMINAKFDKNKKLLNRQKMVQYCKDIFISFAIWYLALRMKDQDSGGFDDFNEAARNFNSVSEEVASIFIDGLVHVINKPEDMITARTDPDPLPEELTALDEAKLMKETVIEKLKELDLNPFD